MPVQLPAVHRPLRKVSTQLTLQLPRDSGPSPRVWLRDALGSGVPIKYVRGHGNRWEVAAHHLAKVIDEVVQRYGRCTVIVDTNEREVCTAACQNANAETAWMCECSCGGKNHGGGGGMRWSWVSEDAELMVEWQMIRHTYVVEAQQA